MKPLNMPEERRSLTMQWAVKRAEVGHDSPARDVALLLLEVAQELHYMAHPHGSFETCARCGFAHSADTEVR